MIKVNLSRKTRDIELQGDPMTLLTDSVCLSLAIINEVAKRLQTDADKIMDAYICAMKESVDYELVTVQTCEQIGD